MLTIIQVGKDQASCTYVRNKVRAVMEAGMDASLVTMEETATTQDVISQIKRAAECEICKAIIVQLPLPSHIDKAAVMAADCIPRATTSRSRLAPSCAGSEKRTLTLRARTSRFLAGVSWSENRWRT